MTNVAVYSVGTTLVAVLNNELVDCLMDNVGISRVEVLTVLRNIKKRFIAFPCIPQASQSSLAWVLT